MLSHPARDVEADRSAKAAGRYNQHVVAPMRRRTRDEVARFLDGLEIAGTGLVQMHQWRPEASDPVAPSCGYAVVARKP